MGKPGKKKGKDGPAVIENRRARHDYAIGETLEVGIKLHGSEVKSVRDGNVSLKEGYVSVDGDPPQLTLRQVTIGEYPPAGNLQHELARTRRLLAHRTEIRRLAKRADEKGVTIVPLKLYFSKEGWAKLLIGVGEGRQAHDKRKAIADREMDREMRRAMSKRM
ncbi:MAG: SsrA-binding protein SmpB [Planctomycetota bacterium]